MGNLVQGIGFSLSCLVDLEDEARARRVIACLLGAPPLLRPVKYGAFEPLDRRIDPGDPQPLVELWLNAKANRGNEGLGRRLGSLLLGGAGVTYQVNWQKSRPPRFSLVGGDISLSLVRKTPAALGGFLGLVKELVSIVTPVYGEVRNMSFAGWDLPFDLEKRLPDVPWVSVYGPPYVALFGREKILGAPFHRIEELASASFWLQVSESALEPVPEETRAGIRRYFGEDSFMSGGRWRYADGRAPRFDFGLVLHPVVNNP